MSAEPAAKGTLWAVALAGVGALLALGEWWTIAAVPRAPWLGAIAVAALATLVLARWSAPRLACVIIFDVVGIVLLYAVFRTNDALARTELRAELFSGFKMIAIGGAMLAPAGLVGAVPVLVAAIILPVVEYWTWPSPLRALTPLGEPWDCLAYGIIAVGLVLHRRRATALEREVTRAHAEKQALELRARMLLAIRDLANSPLQSLTADVTLLRAEAEPARVLPRMERAVERLTEVTRLLGDYEGETNWRPEDAAFDARELLERQRRGR